MSQSRKIKEHTTEEIIEELSQLGICVNVLRRKDNPLGLVDYLVMSLQRGEISFLLSSYYGNLIASVPAEDNEKIIRCRSEFANHKVASRRIDGSNKREFYTRIRNFEDIKILLDSIQVLFLILERR